MKKKILIAFLLMLTVLFGVRTTKVLAGNGPSDEYSFITFYNPEAEDSSANKSIYEPKTVNNDALEGATYDKSTNTLTLNNLKTDLSLAVNEMGEDFKINLVGENEIPYMIIYGYGYGGNVEFTGNGSLTVNKDNKSEIGIVIAAEGTVGKLVVDDTVALKVYGSENAILVGYSSESDNSKVIVLKNGDDISKNIKTEKQISKIPQQMDILLFNDAGSTSYTVATKDDKKYAVSQLSSGTYIVQNQTLVYDEVNERYFFDPMSNPTGSGVNQQYSSLDELQAAGYTMTEEKITVNYWVDYGPRPLAEDNNGKKYIFTKIYYSADEVKYNIYDITNNKITLYNGKEYTVITPNDEIEMDSLSELTEDLDEGYSHIIELKEFEVLPKSSVKEVVKAEDIKSDNDKAAALAVNTLLDAAKNGEKVNGMSDELISTINEAVENGDTVVVELETTNVDEKNVNDDIKKKIESVVKKENTNILGYFDINLLVKINDDTLDDKVTELNDEIEVKLDVSELVNKLDKVANNKVRKYYVVRVHNDDTDVIEATLNDDNILSFKTDRFSSYTVTYKDVNADSVNPKTLDNIGSYVLVGFISLIGLFGIILCMKKKNN